MTRPAVDRRVRIRAVNPDRPPITLHLVGPDQLTGGVGAWETLSRPRRRDAVEWTGTTAFTYVLPLLLDGMEHRPGVDISVEADCWALLDWASEATKKTDQPCIVKISGPLQPPAGIRWVITGIEWGDKVRNRAGRRVQQYVTLTLRQYVEAAVLKGPAAKSKHHRGGK